MSLADQAATAGHDGQVTSGKPEPPKSQTFTREFKAKIAAEFDAPPVNSPERGTTLRKNRLYHSHIEDWKKQLDSGSPASGGRMAVRTCCGGNRRYATLDLWQAGP